MVWIFYYFFFNNNVCTTLLIVGCNGCSFILKLLINVLVFGNTSAMAGVLFAISIFASKIAMSAIGMLQASMLLPHLTWRKLCQLESDYIAGALTSNNLGWLVLLFRRAINFVPIWLFVKVGEECSALVECKVNCFYGPS